MEVGDKEVDNIIREQRPCVKNCYGKKIVNLLITLSTLRCRWDHAGGEGWRAIQNTGLSSQKTFKMPVLANVSLCDFFSPYATWFIINILIYPSSEQDKQMWNHDRIRNLIEFLVQPPISEQRSKAKSQQTLSFRPKVHMLCSIDLHAGFWLLFSSCPYFHLPFLLYMPTFFDVLHLSSWTQKNDKIDSKNQEANLSSFCYPSPSLP